MAVTVASNDSELATSWPAAGLLWTPVTGDRGKERGAKEEFGGDRSENTSARVRFDSILLGQTNVVREEEEQRVHFMLLA
jgi:hypothetical protein